MEKEVFEVVLNKSFNDSKIKRIIDLKWESALPKGENYASTILKATLRVVLGNGRIAKKTFIAKKENSGEAAKHFKNDLNFFNYEVAVYTNILAEMENLMEEFGVTEGPLWCKFIHYSPADSIIILEDLKSSGFVTVNRTEMQSLEHAKLVLRSLARFHAMGKVLEQRGVISVEGYKPHPFVYNDFFMRNIIYGGICALVKGMKKGWGEEWSEYANEFSQMSFEQFSKRMKACGNLKEGTFKCLNHGDCWNNNMMFRHDWEGRPIELRLLDFQIPHYNSPCVDITYFMYASIKPNVRRQNMKSLIELYHRSLIEYLDRFGYEGPKPSLEDINEAMDQLSFFGLSFFLGVIPCMLTERTDGMDFDVLMSTNGEEGRRISVYYEDKIIENMAEDLKVLFKIRS